MGQRFGCEPISTPRVFRPRSGHPPALKRYGMILADNGSAWYISGTPDERWDNDMLVGEWPQVLGSDSKRWTSVADGHPRFGPGAVRRLRVVSAAHRARL